MSQEESLVPEAHRLARIRTSSGERPDPHVENGGPMTTETHLSEAVEHAKPCSDGDGVAAAQPERSGYDVYTAIERLWKEFSAAPEQSRRDRLVWHYAPLVKYVAGRVGTGLPTHVDVG